MNCRPTIIILLLLPFLLGACGSKSLSADERAENYISRLESAQAITAEEYADMVEFYGNSIDRRFDRLEPLIRDYTRALDAGDTVAARQAGAAIQARVDSLAATPVVRLGHALAARLTSMPDSTRARFAAHLRAVHRRIAGY